MDALQNPVSLTAHLLDSTPAVPCWFTQSVQISPWSLEEGELPGAATLGINTMAN